MYRESYKSTNISYKSNQSQPKSGKTIVNPAAASTISSLLRLRTTGRSVRNLPDHVKPFGIPVYRKCCNFLSGGFSDGFSGVVSIAMTVANIL